MLVQPLHPDRLQLDDSERSDPSADHRVHAADDVGLHVGALASILIGDFLVPAAIIAQFTTAMRSPLLEEVSP
jgi:hypothetical protein